jgi:predicted ATPase
MVRRTKFYSSSPQNRLDRFALESSSGERVAKKATIIISLVDESSEKTNEEIREEISQELSKGWTKIPWCKKVEKVTVA